MGHQKELLSGFSRCFERIFLLLFSFDNPFSHFVGVNALAVALLAFALMAMPHPTIEPWQPTSYSRASLRFKKMPIMQVSARMMTLRAIQASTMRCVPSALL